MVIFSTIKATKRGLNEGHNSAMNFKNNLSNPNLKKKSAKWVSIWAYVTPKEVVEYFIHQIIFNKMLLNHQAQFYICCKLVVLDFSIKG